MRFRFVATLALFLATSACDVLAQTIDAYNPVPGGPPASLAVQADGRVILVGSFLTVGATAITRVARLNVDGSLDATFTNPNIDSDVRSIAVQPDGKLLIGGSFTQIGGQPRHGLARLEADGTLDTGFADPGLDGAAWSIAIQPDGRILAGGDFTHIDSVAHSYFARFNANGSLDDSFPDPQLCCNVVRAVALQANGDVLIGGYFSQAAGVDASYLVRFSGSGVFDPSFPNLPDSLVLIARAIVVTPDGSILIPGNSSPSVYKLHADGTLDSSFTGASSDSGVDQIALQPNGKMLVSGIFEQVGGQPRHALARLDADGALDASFADLGFSFSATNPNGYIYGLAAQANGDVVAVGNFTLVGTAPRQYVARVVTGNHATSELQVLATGAGITATWVRSGDGPELAQPPQLLHSTDGVNFAPVGVMTRVADGWQASADFDVHGARFYLEAAGVSSGGALNGSPGAVASGIYSSDTIFNNDFE